MVRTIYTCDMCGEETENQYAVVKKRMCTSIAPIQHENVHLCQYCNNEMMKAVDVVQAKVFGEANKKQFKRSDCCEI